MDLSKTASPVEIVYTTTFALAFVLALANSVRTARSMWKVVQNRLRTGENGAQWAIAVDALEQSVLITVVALALLGVGVVSLYLPANPANPNSIYTAVAFLVAAVAIAVMIVRKRQWLDIISTEIAKKHTHG